VIGYDVYRDVADWEQYIGNQIKGLRLRMNLSQDELSRRASVSTVTVSRLESGKGSTLASLIRILQVLRQEDWLEQLAPETSISPIQVHNLGKPRQRARSRRGGVRGGELHNGEARGEENPPFLSTNRGA
jgi:transcriptional regulator with XRE-family HTH domain